MITGDELRAAMRRFAAGAAVLALEHDGARLAVTVGSLVSLSLEPPLVGVALGVHSPQLEPLRLSRRFSLSLLAADQEALAQHFARGGIPPLALWSGVAIRERAGDPPLLEGALAWLVCTLVAEHAAGDHVLLVSRVDRVELGRAAEALVYVDGAYRAA